MKQLLGVLVASLLATGAMARTSSTTIVQHAEGGKVTTTTSALGPVREVPRREHIAVVPDRVVLPARCPPGLAKKNNGCLPPGIAKRHDSYPPVSQHQRVIRQERISSR